MELDAKSVEYLYNSNSVILFVSFLICKDNVNKATYLKQLLWKLNKN